jgi:hypothetical protein
VTPGHQVSNASVKASQDAGGSAKLVADYDLYCEGDLEPHLGKKIHSLVYKDHTLIVYLDPDLNVEWAYTDNYGEIGKDAGQILNRATELQALPVSHLTDEQIEAFRMLIGEAVARILGPGTDLTGAQDALDKAASFLQARNREITRWWYLQAALVSATLVIALAVILWLFREYVRPFVGVSAFDILIGGGAGAGGALLSILTTSKGLGNEPYATRRIHLFLGVARILAGTLGAILAAFALKSGFISIGSTNRHELFLLVCMVAGLSERLVPNFIERVESGVATSSSSSKPRRG